MTAVRAAVTGASGFIGTALVQRLVQGGYEVTATDRFAPSEPLPVERFRLADINETETLTDVIAGADVVFHLAALPSIERRPEEHYRVVNAGGTETVMRLARAAGVRRVVHLSSSTVYGVPQDCPVTEDAPPAPQCPYSRSKLAAEQVAARFSDDGLAVTIIRPRVVVGPGRAGIFALVFAFLRHGLPVPLPGGGRNLFQFTGLDDLVAACLRAADADREAARLELFNIGSHVEQTLRDELAALRRHAGSNSPLVGVPHRPFTATAALLHKVGLSPLVPEQYLITSADFVLDTRRARSRLGFVPRQDNHAGLLEAWDWWLAHRAGGAADLLRWWKPRYQSHNQVRR